MKGLQNMILQTNQFFLDKITKEDYDEILALYNSNIEFLEKHLGLSQVTREWLNTEMDSMKAIDFMSYKIVDNSSGKILGIMDFKNDIEAYLSILILHKNFKGKGIGSLFLDAFFTYLKSIHVRRIRIDVVIEYNPNVLLFWKKHGFEIIEEATLNWNGNILPAVTMIKYLN